MPQLFLNERSCGTTADPERVNRAMNEMVAAVLALARADRKGTALITHADSLLVLELAQGHSISKWMGAAGTDRDARGRLKQLDDKSPFRTVFPEGETYSGLEYRHGGEVVEGLGWAHQLGGIGISLPLETRWDADRLTLEREELLDDEDGGPALTEVEVRHAARAAHIDTHLPWIREEKEAALRGDLSAIRTGAELWERCPGLFPHLLFLPHVEAQVRGLKQDWVHPVRKRLAEMDGAVLDWDAAIEPEGPWWGSKVTLEHQGRKRDHCLFTDLDGEPRYFDTHLRFTPDEGRVHFRFVKETRRVHIAHIGGKLGI